MNAVLKAKPLTPTMEACLAFMRGEPDRSVHRHRGGVWSRYAFTFEHAWQAGTVEALVTRGHAHYSEFRDGRLTADGQQHPFPVRCTLSA